MMSQTTLFATILVSSQSYNVKLALVFNVVKLVVLVVTTVMAMVAQVAVVAMVAQVVVVAMVAQVVVVAMVAQVAVVVRTAVRRRRKEAMSIPIRRQGTLLNMIVWTSVFMRRMAKCFVSKRSQEGQ